MLEEGSGIENPELMQKRVAIFRQVQSAPYQNKLWKASEAIIDGKMILPEPAGSAGGVTPEMAALGGGTPPALPIQPGGPGVPMVLQGGGPTPPPGLPAPIGPPIGAPNGIPPLG